VRPTKEIYFSSLASVVATRSTCLRRQHGSVLVSPSGAILGTGYNGAPCGVASCDELGDCERERLNIAPGTQYEKCKAVHSEANAIIQAARHGVATLGATLYVTGAPCLMCARAIVNAGIAEVVFMQDRRYNPEDSLGLLGEAGVRVREL
jgi:dCMP deaminase